MLQGVVGNALAVGLSGSMQTPFSDSSSEPGLEQMGPGQLVGLGIDQLLSLWHVDDSSGTATQVGTYLTREAVSEVRTELLDNLSAELGLPERTPGPVSDRPRAFFGGIQASPQFPVPR